MIRLGLSACLTLLLCSVSAAVPLLRADISVSGPIVTAGDLFEHAGAFASTPVFRAPAPGTAGLVPLADVTAATRAAGLTAFDSAGLAEIRVARFGALIDDLLLADLVRAEIAARSLAGAATIVRPVFDRPGLSLQAEAALLPAQLENFSFAAETGRFTARFRIAGRVDVLESRGRVDLLAEAPHLAVPLAAGTIIAATDIEMRAVPLRLADAAGALDPAQIVGKQLRRSSRAGMLLRPADVTEPLVITRNQTVTVYLRRGALTLSVKGKAVTSAAAGQPVQVLNSLTRKILYGIARPDGAVELDPVPQLAIAGL